MKRLGVLVFLAVCTSAFAAHAYVQVDEQSSGRNNIHDSFVDNPMIEKTFYDVPMPDFSIVDFTNLRETLDAIEQAKIEEVRALYGKCGEWKDLAIEIGWPEDEWKTLSQVMWRESKCQPGAFSGSDAGLMQINRIHTEWSATMGWKWPDDLFVAENNLTFAYRLWSTSGWSPWRFSGPVPD